ncbi:MAG: hypothetical protein Q7S77_01340 [Candidatus Staskawiczbacteria bacterium]|nr:hypothetical protein [Candidatus Staskawiczbacteria bacterium]
MITERIFYPDHDQRYAHLPPRVREEYPDEVKLLGIPTIKREKKFAEMTREDMDHYGPTFIRLAAKDIPIREGMKE